ncbi:lysosomal acid glucosylceramidase-like isoform X2 [Schistocerca americana]|nr:lysosomal acid glucosylceramidase-like isoform X2 [Schistocerca americana]
MGFVRMSTGLWLLISLTVIVVADQQCVPKYYGDNKIVCVCNATYCDTIDKPAPVPSGQYLLYTSNEDGLRFNKSTGSFTSTRNIFRFKLTVDPTTTYQTIHGFGTAFTDSAGVNVASLSNGSQINLMRSYFSTSGIELNMGRVPIGGCDFSTHAYSYDDYENDTSLSHFNLTDEDYNIKIPLIKWAQAIRGQNLKLVGAAWSPPKWMKTNNDFVGFSLLKDEYFQEWADYHIKFLDAYKNMGLEFWAVSTGNEPSNGIIPINRFNSLGWTPKKQRKWIAENFGPALRASQHSSIKLLVLDDQRFLLPWMVNLLMEDEKVQNYVDGVAVHWYWDTFLPASLLSQTHNKYPSKFIIATEASIGDKPWDITKVVLGEWSRGEQYMADIIQDLTHWVTGWIDWNLALNPEGGPNWVNNYVDSAVIVNATSDEFYKQPMFYAMGHFSKFVPEGSVRISIEPNDKSGLKSVAFRTPDNATVIVMYNEKNSDTKIQLVDPNRGNIDLTIPKRSFNSLLYW